MRNRLGRDDAQASLSMAKEHRQRDLASDGEVMGRVARKAGIEALIIVRQSASWRRDKAGSAASGASLNSMTKSAPVPAVVSGPINSACCHRRPNQGVAREAGTIRRAERQIATKAHACPACFTKLAPIIAAIRAAAAVILSPKIAIRRPRNAPSWPEASRRRDLSKQPKCEARSAELAINYLEYREPGETGRRRRKLWAQRWR